MKNDNPLKEIKITCTPGSMILSKGQKSIEVLVFSPQEVARLQEIAQRIYAEKAACRNKLVTKVK